MNRLETLKQNADTLIGEEDLLDRLQAGKKLRIKLGVDPTRPDLTFGHMVVFNKMRQFQELGHDCILLIGDFTATIGDPSGRSATRPVLTENEVRQNADTYLEQAFRILEDERTIVRYNSEWFNKMSFADCLDLARKMTVARMLERDDFSKRHQSGTPISIVEFLYPLVQGYDSIMLQSDVELGGTDQLFNMLVGRQLQKEMGKPPQAVMTLPLLVGLDGVRKMSKSQDNYIAFNDTPSDMFQKVMSIADETMWDYYRLLLMMDQAGIQRHKAEHPRQAKMHLASALVAQFHSLSEARRAMQDYDAISQHGVPENAPVFEWSTLVGDEVEVSIIDLIVATESAPSKKEARRIVEQGGVKIDGCTVSDLRQPVFKPADSVVIQVGKKRFFRVTA